MTKKRRILSSVLAMTIAALSISTGAFAADTTDTGTGSVSGTVAINGTISPLTISVTHPVNAGYAIDPNSGSTTSIVAPDLEVTNNTKVPVVVTVDSLSAAPGGSLTFSDVDSSAKEWGSLGLADSKKYIALGIAAKSTGWNTGYNTGLFKSVSATPMQVGSLNPDTTGALALSASHGLAFDSNYTANHNLVFNFRLE